MRKSTILFIVLGSAMSGLCFIQLQSSAQEQLSSQNNNASSQVTLDKSYQDEPTVITNLPLSTKQKSHRKLYKDYSRNLNIRDEVAKQGGFRTVLRWETEPVTVDQLICSADAIIVGSILKKSSQLTESNNFIFTDYEVQIAKVLKNNNTSILVPFSNITLTHPGGKILLEGNLVEARDANFGFFKLNHNYLLFITYLPDSASYKLVHSAGELEFDKENLRTFRRAQLEGWSSDSDDVDYHFIEKRITAMLPNCDGVKRGEAK